jgi:hypothetical protein
VTFRETKAERLAGYRHIKTSVEGLPDPSAQSADDRTKEHWDQVLAARALIESLELAELDDLLSSLRPSTQFKMKGLLK